MIVHCPRCDRTFDTDIERDLDPNGIVCGQCVCAIVRDNGTVPAWSPCIGKDRLCPCQDGDACHYRDLGETKAMPIPHRDQDIVDRLIDLYGKPWPTADWQDVVKDAAIYCYKQHGPYSGHTLSLAARMPTRELACEVIRASQEYGTILPCGPDDPADLNPEMGHGGGGGYSEVRNPNGSHR